MKRTILFLTLASFFMITSCGSNKNEKLREEVIAVHDEVMPNMGRLKSLERQALQKVEDLEKAEPVDSLKIEEYKAIAYDLNHAHEAMFEWMHQYNPADGDQSEEELKLYLDNQMVLISEVNVEMKEALAKAEKMLK